ncbi:acyl-CoA thioesterase [Motiliproteus coralliicola]|uniref:Acyl-CoA thioesterase n=1 Tax=Motiliproteus coralliicola TaxID=2283196 RepID=A0A369WF77_9GAMM|nr:thioesterase family protein [Motiliproteus coralliicola]RDE18125.1 acyl-CoA thioesterase [Motiliproteus coralliicola]
MTFSIDHPIRWGDMDALGHLNNTLYFRLFEEARVQWLAEIGSDFTNSDQGPVIVHAACDFLYPVVYPATTRVSITVEEIGRSSFVLAHHLSTAQQPERTFAEGPCKVVWIDYRQNRSVPLPDSIRQKLERYRREQ